MREVEVVVAAVEGALRFQLDSLAGTRRLAPPPPLLGQPAASPPSRDQCYGGPLAMSYSFVFNIARSIFTISILILL